ncbi:sugar transferase [Roseovarius salis]|uniref:sugar transferase n=1 Tax=Roseovarius salis TaxID=3376063 RepID=UPI0037CB3C98
MTPSKRAMDIALALLLGILLAGPILLIALWVFFVDGWPVLYRSERMKTPHTPFTLWKFRTMKTDHDDTGVSGGYKAARITRTGRILRRTRLDELPQLYNILVGDMSFVGPRPPLRRYVELRPDIYAEVLRNRPGVTGLATLTYHAREERLLAGCRGPQETETVYLSRCVPAKARLDLFWARRRSLCYDTALMFETVRRVFLKKRPE